MSKSRKKMMTRVREFAVLSGQDPIMSFYSPMWGAIYDVENRLPAEGSEPPGKRSSRGCTSARGRYHKGCSSLAKPSGA